jgi:hypothetical protein
MSVHIRNFDYVPQRDGFHPHMHLPEEIPFGQSIDP